MVDDPRRERAVPDAPGGHGAEPPLFDADPASPEPDDGTLAHAGVSDDEHDADGASDARDADADGEADADAATTGDQPRTAAVTPEPISRRQRRADRRRHKQGSFLRELPVLLLVAFVLAFLLRTFVVQVFYIPSSSMEPTLQVDDRMVVEKLTYRFRDPVRGEVVVFEGDSFGVVDPDATLGTRLVRGVGQFLGVVPANARDYVKRVIGLPGDEVLIEDGRVSINGVELDEPYVVFPDGGAYGPVTVPDGTLFFLGDNRPNSSDSRRSLGFVPIEQVVGRAGAIIWPPEHAGLLTRETHELPSPPPAG